LRRQINDAVLDDDGNPISGVSPDFTDLDLADFWEDAQNDLVLYVGRTTTFAIPANVTSAELPDDLYSVMWVRYDITSETRLIKELDLEVEVRDVDDPHWEGLYWYITDDTIEFTSSLQYQVTVRYRAFYPVPSPTNRDQPIYVPRWAVQALLYYCTAEAVERKVVEDPDLRRWADRNTDAGKPTDNPFLQVAKYFLGRYQDVVNKHLASSQERSTWPSSYR
jgi:hypothetical protein